MPKISRVFVKVSLVWLALALTAGGVMTFGAPAMMPILLPTHVHMFVVGWVTHMIAGVAIWLFPRASKESPRGNITFAWISLAGLSVGLLLRCIAEPGQEFFPRETTWGALLVASSILQWIGGVALAANLWPRVKTRDK